MGLLSDDFFNTLNKAPSTTNTPVSPVSTDQSSITPTVIPPSLETPTINVSTQEIPEAKSNNFFSEKFNPSIHLAQDLTPEQQTEKFGGPVGSPAYLETQAKRSVLSYLPAQLASVVGINLPSQQEWDKMSFANKAATLNVAATSALAKTVKNAPKEIIKAPIRVIKTIVDPWVELAKGGPATLESLSNKPVTELPWLGAVPTLFQSYQQARDSGMGPLMASVSSGSAILLDTTVGAALAEGVTGAMRPRAKIVPGEMVQNVEPIKSAIIRDASNATFAIRKAPGSTSEYYSLPKSVVTDNYGTNPNNTFLKVTPASSESVEISVVQLRGGKIPQAVDWVKGKFGVPDKNYQGDFGPEIKLDSKIVPVTPAETAGVKAAAPISEIEAQKIIGTIPPAPLKGFEKAPITSDQLKNIEQIGQVNGIEPGIRDAIIRTVTGKKVMGELTQTEYVKSAQTLSLFNNLAKYAPDAPSANLFSQYVAPQRHWMRSYEENSGIPLYSEAYVPMEEATRLRNVFRDSYRTQAREIFGKYAEPGFGEERRLISAYMRGEKNAITGNTVLSDTTKTELINIAGQMRKIYDTVGPKLDVPTDIFLSDYQPRIQNIGGIYQLYKEGSEIPKQLDFFAKFKRKGNVQGIQIDDSLALFDIYINSGSNRLFLNPALERISALAEKLPPTLHDSVKSYVFEKMGYAGRMEQFLDSTIPDINRKLGINLPPDSARQMTNLTLSTMYSGLLSSPATWFRQTFQYPMFGYARLGPRFAADAIKKGLTKEGIAEAEAKGFLVELGVPYGEEIAKDITLGGKAGNLYKNVTQKFITPNSIADNGMRSIVYHQSKMQFDDALARYNGGKISWPQFEKEIDLNSFSPIDRNIIRSRLVSGNIEGARDHMIRDIIDETNFPYRRGASSRIGYGLGGKIGTSLLQWPIEAIGTLSRWTRTGQWDKLIRFAAASSAVHGTLKQTFGFDFVRSFGFTPFSNFYSPFVKTAVDFANALNQFGQQNKEEMNKSADSIVRTLKSMSPLGVEARNVSNFYRSYKLGQNADGQFPVVNDKNEVRYYTDFNGLFWGVLMGFPTNQRQSESQLSTDIRNAQFDRSQIKDDVLKLLQQEKYDEATKMMQETGVTVGPKDFDDYYIPVNQRSYQTLSPFLKAQFAPRVFPEAFKK